MGRLSLAWKILTNSTLAGQFEAFLKAPASLPAPAAPATPPATQAIPAPAKPQRSEAISLLATLQREGRLLDFLKEPIDAYSDAQIGAAVRDIHRDCAGGAGAAVCPAAGVGTAGGQCGFRVRQFRGANSNDWTESGTASQQRHSGPSRLAGDSLRTPHMDRRFRSRTGGGSGGSGNPLNSPAILTLRIFTTERTSCRQ
ncbi:MAG UNVERIFIED_CONTAM: DUF2760 domain-containing protein [Planctomycetaceae bacterium]